MCLDEEDEPVVRGGQPQPRRVDGQIPRRAMAARNARARLQAAASKYKY